MSKLALLLLASTFALSAQDSPQGVAMEWDVRKQVVGIADQVRVLQTTLSAASPDQWVKAGAPEAYARQLQSTQSYLANLVVSAKKLASDPDSLPYALETYFRMVDLERIAGSLNEGVHKYQSPSLAERLAKELAAVSNSRETLRQHVTDLAAAREQEWKIMNDEAQRCRGMLSRQADPPARRPRTSPSKGARP